jgi:lysophospholipase L1-like esterase
MLRAALSRVGLVALGLALALLVGEGLLQAGAAVVRWTGREAPAALSGGKRRIVCLGDSNTYGIYVERDQPYPQTLEKLIAEPDGSLPPTEVLNLGFPGNNSSKIRHALPRILRELRPDIVTLMVGTNDWWTEPEPDPGRTKDPPTLTDWLYRHSRMYRLMFMIRRSLRTPTVSVDRRPNPDRSSAAGSVSLGETVFEWQWQKREGGVTNWAPALRDNLRAMVQLCREQGVQPVLLTYPAEVRTYGKANEILRQEAAAAGVPLIDLGATFRGVCPDPPCDEWFFLDNHPKPIGYRLVAEQIRDWLLEQPR